MCRKDNLHKEFKKNGLCFVYTMALEILFLEFWVGFLVGFFVVCLVFFF